MKITLNDAGNGDCILIQSDNTNILIDGGTGTLFDTWYPLIKELDKIDALFITHIDDDHTNGIIKFLEKNDKLKSPIEIKHIYFNGIEQLFDIPIKESDQYDDKYDSIKACFDDIEGSNEVGFSEGTSLSYILKNKKVNTNIIHNESFDEIMNIGNFTIELIGPNINSLEELKDSWEVILNERSIKRKILTKNHKNAFESYVNSLNEKLESEENISSEYFTDIDSYANSKYEKDSSLANKTSFSFLIKCNNKSFLMLGDAHIETVLDWLNKKDKVLSVDAIKVSHHGSKFNIKKEFLELMDCNKYLISTNGKKHHHPDIETLARIAKFSKKENTEIIINNNINHITKELIDTFTNYENKTNIIMNRRETIL